MTRIRCAEDLPPGRARDAVRAAMAAEAGRAMREAAPRMADAYERQIAGQFEEWLNARGYWSPTKDRIAAGPPPLGWYFHMPNQAAKGNPLLLDYVILANDGRWMTIELKRVGGRIKAHQRQLLAGCGFARLAYSAVEAAEYVLAWESERDKDGEAAEVRHDGA